VEGSVEITVADVIVNCPARCGIVTGRGITCCAATAGANVRSVQAASVPAIRIRIGGRQG
jgi:hypothetical protein